MLSNFSVFLKEKNQLNKNTYYFRFNLIEPKEINFIPGQYVILKINEKTRLYSIASSIDQKNSFDLLIKIIPQGLASNYFLNLNINDKINFLGPAGIFKLKKNSNKKIFLSVSTGIAPFLSMIKSKNYNFENDYFLFWGLKYKEDVYFLEKLKEIKNNSNKKFNFKI
ncbi:MAG: FAD-dependent oxidoreductase, partial [Patescibacteria group bacterium]|nr:FAD-dependent oxidoreductase [Patescibacteria group bacterium]